MFFNIGDLITFGGFVNMDPVGKLHAKTLLGVPIDHELGMVIGIEHTNGRACSTTAHWAAVSSLREPQYYVFVPKDCRIMGPMFIPVFARLLCSPGQITQAT